jgi:ABC-type glutathione transport system ATPase component
MTSTLVVDNLTVSLGPRVLVDNVSFRVAAGERVAVLGRSGSGKSLTAGAVLGQLPSAMRVTGSMALNGRSIPLGNRGLDRAGNFAGIHQDPTTALHPMVRLGRQLTIPWRNRGLTAQAAREQAAALLDALGIRDSARVLSGYSGELSGGQLQRVCIAFALASRCSVLVADEPTTALDSLSQAKVMEAFKRIAGTAAALLYITHDVAVAAALCTRALVLDSGRIVEQGPLDELLARPRHGYTVELVRAAQMFAPASA